MLSEGDADAEDEDDELDADDEELEEPLAAGIDGSHGGGASGKSNDRASADNA